MIVACHVLLPFRATSRSSIGMNSRIVCNGSEMLSASSIASVGAFVPRISNRKCFLALVIATEILETVKTACLAIERDR